MKQSKRSMSTDEEERDKVSTEYIALLCADVIMDYLQSPPDGVCRTLMPVRKVEEEDKDTD